MDKTMQIQARSGWQNCTEDEYYQYRLDGIPVREITVEQSLPPLQAVSDEEIERIALEKYPVILAGLIRDDVNENPRDNFISGMKAMRDRTPPSQAETILRAIRDTQVYGNRLGPLLSDDEYNDILSKYYEMKEASQNAMEKWCADNPVKADNTKE